MTYMSLSAYSEANRRAEFCKIKNPKMYELGRRFMFPLQKAIRCFLYFMSFNLLLLAFLCAYRCYYSHFLLFLFLPLRIAPFPSEFFSETFAVLTFSYWFADI
jgi:hypothetical protein